MNYINLSKFAIRIARSAKIAIVVTLVLLYLIEIPLIYVSAVMGFTTIVILIALVIKIYIYFFY
jgi:hypothetical protein